MLDAPLHYSQGQEVLKRGANVLIVARTASTLEGEEGSKRDSSFSARLGSSDQAPSCDANICL